MKQPKLRFNADDGTKFPDWKEKRLNDVCEYNKGQSVGINYVGTENMKQDFSGVNDLDSENKVKGVTYNIGDTLMSNIRPYLKKTWKADIKGVCSTDVLVFHPTNINSDYLYRNISSEKFISYVMTAAKGSKMPRGDKEHIMNYDIQVPCLPEQQKIASLFAEIDTLIQSAEKELEGYRELKQGMLQKMFPKTGETVPEIRFPEFTGDWEEHELSEMFNYEQPSKYIVKNNDYEGCSKYPVLTANKGFILGYTDETEGIYDKGEVIIFDDFTCDHKFVNFPFKVKSSAIKFLTPKVNYNLSFLSELLNVMNQQPLSHQRHWISVMQPSIALTPSLEEQKKIGEYFSNLDNLIAFQQKEIDGYKELKKGLLQQMFC